VNASVPLASLALVTIFAPGLSAPSPQVAPVALHAQLDHIMIAIRSLPEGIAEFERLTGVKAGIGGKHPGRGTENALVSLGGGSYVEIIAPQPDATLFADYERMRTLDHLTIFTWAVGVTDVAAAAAALTSAGLAVTPPQPGARVTPAGERLEWSTFNLADRSMAIAPFFIQWSPGTKHPSTTSPGGCSVSALKLQDPAIARLSAGLNALGVSGVTFAEGPPAIEATLKCGSKTVTIKSM
jgi:Glyoxalase-like domain